MKRIFIVLIVCLLLGCGSSNSTSSGENEKKTRDNSPKITVIDFNGLSQDEIQNWGAENNIKIVFEQQYSSDVEDGGYISQSIDANASTKEGDTIKIVYSLGEEPPKEYQNALSKAKLYSDTMHMSKAGLFNQLTSEYGEKFTTDAAEWALDHLNADYFYNALKSAENYNTSMHMSKAGLYDQLTSEYGEKFTAEEAQYAIDNLVADYNENALLTAKNYQETMNMSKSAIYDQLVSSYGEKFTAEEAQYAIDNLDD